MYSLQTPYLGTGLKLDAGKWMADYVDPGGLAYDRGVRPGDQVAIVDGRPVAEVAGLSRFLHHSTVKQASVTLSDGKQIAVEVTNSGPLGMPRVTLVEAICILGVGMAFLLGAIVFAFKGSSQVGVSGLGLLSAF